MARANWPPKDTSANNANPLTRSELLAGVSNQAICVEYLETNTERYAPTSVNATPMMRIHFRYFQSGSSTEPAVRRKIRAQSIRFTALIRTITVHQGQAQAVASSCITRTFQAGWLAGEAAPRLRRRAGTARLRPPDRSRLPAPRAESSTARLDEALAL